MLNKISKSLNFAIIGGGPAGFFCAKKLLKKSDNNLKNLRVDLFDRLPLPFGLIRYGVAPDAPDLKKAQNELSTISDDNRFRFFGNMEIGKDLKLNDISSFYSGMIFAYGASEEYKLNIEGENLKGVCSGKDIAQWYNGHFDYANFELDFSKIRNVSIIGNGNVALDVARVFSRKAEELSLTDISSKAFKLIGNNKIENIFVIARRGPLESAFTLKELRDFSKLNYIDFYALKSEIEVSGGENIKRADKRKMEFMQKTFKILENVEEMNKMISAKSLKKRIIFRYLLSPIKISGIDQSVSSALYQPNTLILKDGLQIAVKKQNAQIETINSELFVKSVGFKSIKIDESIPFDPRKNIIPNMQGMVLKGNEVEKGKYVAGWIKTGPKGTIANTFSDCEETLANIFEHIKNNDLELKEDRILDLLREKNLKFYTFDEWKLIDEYERSIGAGNGKPREKIIDKQTLDNVLKSLKTINT